MKRYDMEYFQARMMVEDPVGKWVRYDDAQAEIEHLKITYENTLDTQYKALGQFEKAHRQLALIRAPQELKDAAARAEAEARSVADANAVLTDEIDRLKARNAELVAALKMGFACQSCGSEARVNTDCEQCVRIYAEQCVGIDAVLRKERGE